MSRLTRDGTAELVSRDQILRHVRGQENIHFPRSADHEQDWQPYPVDPYSAKVYVMTIHTYNPLNLIGSTRESHPNRSKRTSAVDDEACEVSRLERIYKKAESCVI